MKNLKLWMRILAMVLLLTMVGCDNGSTGGGGGGKAPSGSTKIKVSYTSKNFTLNIIESTGRAIPEDGDGYEIRDSKNKVISNGTIKDLGGGWYQFNPKTKGIPPFYGELSEATFHIKDDIILNNGDVLLGLLLSNEASPDRYTSYKAAADAGCIFHNGTIVKGSTSGDAFYNLMASKDYTQIQINDDLPSYSGIGFDLNFILNKLSLKANDYLKWDIEYKNHRILVMYYHFQTNDYLLSYSLVNEILLLPPIDGNNYSSGTIRHVDYEDGIEDEVIDRVLYDNVSFDKFSIKGKAPVDNLGELQYYRILSAVSTERNGTPLAGDYILWNITYNDSTWSVRVFFRNNGFFYTNVHREEK
jgi:hypothetical protein